MKCLKCGAYVYSSDKFCRSCGTTLTNETCQYGDNITNSKYDSSSCHEKQYNYSYEYSNKSTPNYNMNASHAEQYDYSSKYSFDYSKFDYINKPNDSGGDDKYIKAYVGPNYDKIKKMKFSFPALIFGPWYLLYRKVWGYAILAILIFIAATVLLDDLADLVDTIINIVLAIKFQSIYMKQAENNVENIKQQNLDKSTNELLEVCKKKGGTSIFGPIMLVVGSIILFIGILIILVTGGYIPEDILDESYIEEEQNEIVKDTLGNITYSIPAGFTIEMDNTNYKKYVLASTENICNFNIERIPNASTYPSDTSYLLQNIQPTDLSHTISGPITATLDGVNWQYLSLDSYEYIETRYAYKTRNEIYSMKLYNYKNNGQENRECNAKYDEILDSLKIER